MAPLDHYLKKRQYFSNAGISTIGILIKRTNIVFSITICKGLINVRARFFLKPYLFNKTLQFEHHFNMSDWVINEWRCWFESDLSDMMFARTDGSLKEKHTQFTQSQLFFYGFIYQKTWIWFCDIKIHKNVLIMCCLWLCSVWYSWTEKP